MPENKESMDVELNDELKKMLSDELKEKLAKGEIEEVMKEFMEGSPGEARQIVLKDPLIQDFDHEKHPPLLEHYYVEDEEGKTEVKRNVVALLNEIAKRKPETKIKCILNNYDRVPPTKEEAEARIEELQEESLKKAEETGEEPEPVDAEAVVRELTKEVLKTFVLFDGTVDEALDLLPGLIVPAGDVMNQIMHLLNQVVEFTDATAVMITGVFEKQGTAGFTWANPALELDQQMANRIYESCKSHADNYKDKIKKQHGFKFESDETIIKANMSDLRKMQR